MLVGKSGIPLNSVEKCVQCLYVKIYLCALSAQQPPKYCKPNQGKIRCKPLVTLYVGILLLVSVGEVNRMVLGNSTTLNKSYWPQVEELYQLDMGSNGVMAVLYTDSWSTEFLTPAPQHLTSINTRDTFTVIQVDQTHLTA